MPYFVGRRVSLPKIKAIRNKSTTFKGTSAFCTVHLREKKRMLKILTARRKRIRMGAADHP
jgi:hypothetical protein